MHFGVIVTRLTKNINKMSNWIRLMPFPIVNHRRHLHAGTNLQFPSASLFKSLEDITYTEHISILRSEPACFIPLRFILSLMPAITYRIALSHRNRYVIWHKTAFHQHPGLISDHMKDTDERFCRPFQNLDYLTFTTMLLILFTSNSHPYDISIQGSTRLGSLDIDIIIRIFHNNEGKTFTGHLNLTCYLREYLSLFSFTASTAAGTGVFSC